MSTKYLPTKDVAKLVRKALKDTFGKQYPAIRFSVKSSVYSGGSSISVGWTDGPTEKDVKAVVSKYEGASFDGMIDLKSYNDAIMVEGELVKMGVDFIFCNRSYSVSFLQRRAESVASKYGCEVCKVWEEESGWVRIQDSNKPAVANGYYTASELVYQAAARMRAGN